MIHSLPVWCLIVAHVTTAVATVRWTENYFNGVGTVRLFRQNNVFLELQFEANNQSFHVKAVTRHSRIPILTKDYTLITSHKSGNFIVPSENANYLTGQVTGRPECSVYGYEEVFEMRAVISCQQETYSLKVNHRFNHELNYFHFTSSRDHSGMDESCAGLCNQKATQELVRAAQNEFLGRRDLVQKQKSDFSDPETGLPNFHRNKVCSLHLVVDHTFKEFYGGNISRIENALAHIVSLVDSAFRRTDFDEDGRPDNLGFVIQRITVLDKTSPKYNFADTGLTNIDEILNKFSIWLNQPMLKPFCVNVLFMQRSLSKLGSAFTGKVLQSGVRGGFCDEQQVWIPHMGTARVNTVIVTSESRGYERSPEEVALSLLHELGHSFGALHDTDSSRGRSSGCSESGLSVMAKGTMPDHTILENWGFSDCSKLTMIAVIRSKGLCLEPQESTCGDGIIQGDEECDCGSSESCFFMDPCCNPPGKNAKPCRLKSGRVCSPSKSPCCNKKCQVIKDNSVPCYQPYSDCKQLAFCDGMNAECPVSKFQANGNACAMNSLVCQDGRCQLSPCQLKGLMDCTCESPEEFLCSVCCINGEGKCVPASHLKILTPEGNNFTKAPLTYCLAGKGFCNRNHTCVQLHLTEKRRWRPLSKEAYQAIGLTIGFLFLAVILGLCIRRRIKTRRRMLRCAGRQKRPETTKSPRSQADHSNGRQSTSEVHDLS